MMRRNKKYVTMLTLFLVFVVLALQIVILVRVFNINVGDPFSTKDSNKSNKSTTNSTSEPASIKETEHRELPFQIIAKQDGLNVAQFFYSVAPDCQVRDLPQLYEIVFGRKTDGTFVEFGAFDGQFVSNTCGLADMGWRGVYIEPIPEFAEKCRSRHSKNPRVSVVQCAVGPENIPSITLTLGGALTTADSTTLDVFKKTDWSKASFAESKTVNVAQRLLSDILEEQHINPGFDLLVVDIEGFEWEALRNFNLSAWKPKMVIIELEDTERTFHDPTRQDTVMEKIHERFAHLRKYFQDAGYRVAYKDFINTIYIL